MGYQKILVDAPECSRRFHVSFDSDQKTSDHVKLKCPFCNIIIFEANNHPPVTLARQENLVKTQELSKSQVSGCRFKDEFSNK